MILFYSEFCQHCNVLLETIKRHDKNGMIKLVSIDMLRSLNKPIDKKIHSVPALLILNTKEYLFGKQVFDYLLLPNRGVLFSSQASSKGNKDETFKPIGENPSKGDSDEPIAFSLGSISSEPFSSLDDNMDNIINDKNYNFEFITDNNQSGTTYNQPPQNDNTANVPDDGSRKKKNLPSLEEIMSQRANDII